MLVPLTPLKAGLILPDCLIWQAIGCGPEDEDDDPEIAEGDLIRM